VGIFKLISFCTSYLGRREHLEKTYPHNVDVGINYDCEFVLLDYSAYSDKWEVSRAKNKAHYIASGEILINVDADNYLSIPYVNGVLEIFKEDRNVIVYSEEDNVGGRIAISSDNFKKLGGYDERFKDWGYDDIDFIYRARNLGLRMFKMQGLTAIAHGDELRFTGDRYKNRPLMVYNRDNNVTDWRKCGR
jgi:hypothetical protein